VGSAEDFEGEALSLFGYKSTMDKITVFERGVLLCKRRCVKPSKKKTSPPSGRLMKPYYPLPNLLACFCHHLSGNMEKMSK